MRKDIAEVRLSTDACSMPNNIRPNQIEAIHRLKIQSMLMERNWMVYDPAADVGGVDWIAMHLESEVLRKVQQKGRLYMAKKYEGKELWITFLYNDTLYMVPHDNIMKTRFGREAMQTKSWLDHQAYSWNGMSEGRRVWLDEYAIR